MSEKELNETEQLLDAALLKRALGYEVEEKIIDATKDGKPLNIRVIKKHIPPDIKAIEKVKILIKTGGFGKKNIKK